IIASMIEVGEFCNHKVNYLSERRSSEPLEVVLALLNSKLADWYFRLGSTNAAVSHYQLENLPFPIFANPLKPADGALKLEALALLATGSLAEVRSVLSLALAAPPFSHAIRAVL